VVGYGPPAELEDKVKRRGIPSSKTAKIGRRRTTKLKRDQRADSSPPIPARRGHSLVDLQEKLKRQARELEEAREERRAIAEVLRVISSSPGDLKPVFEAMLTSAMRICEANFGHLLLYDGESFHAAHLQNLPPAYRTGRKAQ
jgi:hypothetical protein